MLNEDMSLKQQSPLQVLISSFFSLLEINLANKKKGILIPETRRYSSGLEFAFHSIVQSDVQVINQLDVT